MLKYVVQQFGANESGPAQLQSLLLSYVGLLASEGFLARKGQAVYQQPGRGVAYVAGTLCRATALADAALHPRLARLRTQIEDQLVTEPSVDYFDLTASRDEHYCEHEDWKSLTLICDRMNGTSPLSCNECGGIVARYRPKLAANTSTQLWSWDGQYASIHASWLVSADYESWAARELHEVRSPLNQLGVALAAGITEELRCEVNYFLAAAEDQGHARCPRCGQGFQAVAARRWNVRCPRCRIVTRGG